MSYRDNDGNSHSSRWRRDAADRELWQRETLKATRREVGRNVSGASGGGSAKKGGGFGALVIVVIIIAAMSNSKKDTNKNSNSKSPAAGSVPTSVNSREATPADAEDATPVPSSAGRDGATAEEK